jgi:hypothetical protein
MTQASSGRTIDDLLAEWEGVWLESLKAQIYDVHHRRELHDEFMELLASQDHPDTDIFRDAFHRMYIESQVMAIRRQADDDNRSVSLRRLIGQLEQHRNEFTREWYVARWIGDRDPNSTDERTRLEGRMHLDFANDAFDRFTDKPGDSRLEAKGSSSIERSCSQLLTTPFAMRTRSSRMPSDGQTMFELHTESSTRRSTTLARCFAGTTCSSTKAGS